MTTATMHTYALMDLVGALRQLGATITLPPDVAESVYANGLAPYGSFRTAATQLPFGQAVTDTEIQVLRYLPTHLTVQEIAENCAGPRTPSRPTSGTSTPSSTPIAAARRSETLESRDSWPECLPKCPKLFSGSAATFGASRMARPTRSESPLHPQHIAATTDRLAADAVFTADVGTPCIWAARYLHMNGRRRLVGSFTHGSMAHLPFPSGCFPIR